MSTPTAALGKQRTPVRPARILLHVFLVVTALAWLAPLLWALFAALRPYSETSTKGYVSWPDKLSLDNFTNAFQQSDMLHYFGNTLIIAVPAVLITLLLSSMVAFYVSRFDFRLNIFLLLVFTAGNLLPPQVLFQPLFQMFKAMPWPDFLSDTNTGNLLGTKIAIIIVHVAFQTGFCTFVLSNYMKTIPKELGEAAMVDGATVVRQFFQVVMPLCRPALAALATLEFTWLYNDFFWAVVLLNQGDQRPITSSIANLGGQFFSDDNLIAAASMIIAVPTLAVYLALQRHFISGLTLGASKG